MSAKKVVTVMQLVFVAAICLVVLLSYRGYESRQKHDGAKARHKEIMIELKLIEYKQCK